MTEPRRYVETDAGLLPVARPNPRLDNFPSRGSLSLQQPVGPSKPPPPPPYGAGMSSAIKAGGWPARRPVPTLPDPHEPLNMNGSPWLNAVLLVFLCGVILALLALFVLAVFAPSMLGTWP